MLGFRVDDIDDVDDVVVVDDDGDDVTFNTHR